MLRHAVILAGGEGTRLRPITLEIPKPLVPVQGMPIASWLVRLFAAQGVERVTLVYPTRWRAAFEAWANSVQPIPVKLFEEREPMGTLGALVHESLLEDDEAVFVTNGDELKGLDVKHLAQMHQAEREKNPEHAVTIALVTVPNPSEYGVAELHGSRIVRFHEKPAEPPSSFISSGLYVIEPSVLREVDRTRRFLMFERDLFPRLATEQRLAGCQLSGPWYDCGTLERWETAIKEWPGL